MWIARDKDGSLWLYNEKPIRNKEENDWTIATPTDTAVGTLDTNMFPELKWEDEPIEVDLVDVNKSIITDKDCIDEVYWREVRNNAAIAAMQTLLEGCNNLSLSQIFEKQIFEDVSNLSIACANTLVKKLKSKEVENKRNSN